MIIGYESPHLPWIVPKKYFDLYSSEKIAKTIDNPCTDLLDIDKRITIKYRGYIRKFINMLKSETLADAIRDYLASTSYLDSQVGSLIAALDRSEFAKNTIVIFTSDQGYHLGEKCTMQKQTLWKESSQVPLLMRIPDTSAKLCKKPVSLIDLFPTLIDLCHLQANNNLDGHSFVNLLKNPESVWIRPVVTTQGLMNHAIRTTRWCYISYANGLEELYDRRKDPYEQNNLANNPNHIKTKKQLRKFLPATNAKPLTINSADE
jgi:arylsulfatase A-like enzyme